MELNAKQTIAVKEEIHRLKLLIALDKSSYNEKRGQGATINDLVGLCSEIVEHQHQLRLLQLGRFSELPYVFKLQFPL